MAVETLYLAALAADDPGQITGASAAFGSASGTWSTNIDNSSWDGRFTLDATSNGPTASQTVTLTIRARKQDGTSDPTIDSVAIRNGTTQRGINSTGWSITSLTGQDVVLSISASGITGDGSDLELVIVTSAAGGSPAKRAAVQLDYVSVDVTTTADKSGSGSVAAASATSASATSAHSGTGSTSHASATTATGVGPGPALPRGIVQHTVGTNSNVEGNPTAATFDSTPADGNLILVLYIGGQSVPQAPPGGMYAEESPSASPDSTGFTLIEKAQANGTSSPYSYRFAAYRTYTSGDSLEYGVTAGTPDAGAIFLIELDSSIVDTADLVEAYNSNWSSTASVTTLAGGSVTTASDDALIFAFMHLWQSGGDQDFGHSAGWEELYDVSDVSGASNPDEMNATLAVRVEETNGTFEDTFTTQDGGSFGGGHAMIIALNLLPGTTDKSGSGSVAAASATTATGSGARSGSGSTSHSSATSATGVPIEEASGSGSTSAASSTSATGDALEAASGSGSVSAASSTSASGVPLEAASGSGTVSASSATSASGTAIEEASGSGSVAAASSTSGSGEMAVSGSGSTSAASATSGSGSGGRSGSGSTSAASATVATGTGPIPSGTSFWGDTYIPSSATASSTSGANTPGKAIEDVAGFWQAAAGANVSWIRFDFGSAVTIEGLQLDCQNNDGWPATFSVEGSNNDADWTTIVASHTAHYGTDLVDFVGGETYRYFRISGLTGTGWWILGDARFIHTLDVTYPIAFLGKPYETTDHFDAYDGDLGTKATAEGASASSASSILIDLGSSQEMSRLTMKQEQAEAFVLEYTDDPSGSWTTALTVADSTGDEFVETDYDFTAATARYWRVDPTAGADWVSYYEVSMSLVSADKSGSGAVSAGSSTAASGQMGASGTGTVSASSSTSATGVPLEEVSGSGSVSATSSGSATGSKDSAGTGAASAASSTSATGSPSESASGSGIVSATSSTSGNGSGARSGASSTSSAASTSATGVAIEEASGSGSVASSSSASATGSPDMDGAGVVAASSSTSASALPDKDGAGSTSNSSATSGSGTASETVSGSGSVSAVSSISASGSPDLSGAGAVAASSSTSASGVPLEEAAGSGSVSATSSSTSTGTSERAGSGSTSNSSSTTATGVPAEGASGFGSVTHASSTAATGTKTGSGSGTASATSSTTSSGSGLHSGAGSVAAASSTSGSGTAGETVSGSGSVSATSATAGSGQKGALGTSAVSTGTDTAATGSGAHGGSGSLSGVSSITATGEASESQSGSGSVSAVSSVTATAGKTLSGSGSPIGALSDILAAGLKGGLGAVVLAAVSTVVGSGASNRLGAFATGAVSDTSALGTAVLFDGASPYDRTTAEDFDGLSSSVTAPGASQALIDGVSEAEVIGSKTTITIH